MSDLPPIEFAFPDLRKWEKGTAPYIHVLESGKPGPTVMVASLTHGNEVSGAVVVDALLSAGLKPRKGTLIFSDRGVPKVIAQVDQLKAAADVEAQKTMSAAETRIAAERGVPAALLSRMKDILHEMDDLIDSVEQAVEFLVVVGKNGRGEPQRPVKQLTPGMEKAAREALAENARTEVVS